MIRLNVVISEKNARASKPFYADECIKTCIVSAVEVICAENKQAFMNISLSRNTIAQRVEEMANNVEQYCMKKVNDFLIFLLLLTKVPILPIPPTWLFLFAEFSMILM